jgi:Tfp pilus assembly protein PilN
MTATQAMADLQPATPITLPVPTGFRVARVNLLPPEIQDARRLRRTQGMLAGGLVAVVALLGAGYAYEVHDRHGAERELADVQAQSMRLQNEQAKYADVPKTVAAIDAAELARETAMADDVEWARTLTDFSLSLPPRVRFTSLKLTVGQAAGTTGPTGTTGATGTTGGATGSASGSASGAGSGAATGSAGGATTGAAGSATTSPGSIGTVAIEGSARSQRDLATWLETLSARPGMDDASFSTSQRQKAGTKTIVKFSSTATLNADLLSHRYDRKQG